MQTPTNNSECDMASVMNRLDTLTAIVRVMHTQLNETVSELSETKRNLLEANNHVSRLGRMVVDSNRKNETLEIRMAAMEAAFGSLLEETRQVPGLKTKIDEHKIQLDVLTDKLLAVEDKVESSVGRTDGEPQRIGMLLPHNMAMRHSVYGDAANGVLKSRVKTVRNPLTIMDIIHGYDRDARKMYVHTELYIDDDVAHLVNKGHMIPMVNWCRLIEFPYLEELTIVADAYIGFTRYASSSSCRILKITSVTNCGKDVVEYSNNTSRNCVYSLYYSTSFDWLIRFPKLEVIDFMDTRVCMLQPEDIVAFLPHCPSMRSIRGIGSKDNRKLVRYCSVTGIALEDN